MFLQFELSQKSMNKMTNPSIASQKLAIHYSYKIALLGILLFHPGKALNSIKTIKASY